jgi:23S rRNA pseudouridine2605 synthase
VNGNPTEEMVAPLRKGIVIDRERFKGMEIRLDRQQGSNAWLTIGLREGKNREIRRAMQYVGLKVNRLIRTSYGPFKLDDLKPGDVEEIKEKTVKDQLGL